MEQQSLIDVTCLHKVTLNFRTNCIMPLRLVINYPVINQPVQSSYNERPDTPPNGVRDENPPPYSTLPPSSLVDNVDLPLFSSEWHGPYFHRRTT